MSTSVGAKDLYNVNKNIKSRQPIILLSQKQISTSHKPKGQTLLLQLFSAVYMSHE
jgi:hypothetical protein